MTRRVRFFLWITIHKWTGIVIGGIVMIWVISTLALLLDREPPPPLPSPDAWERAVISPARAVQLTTVGPDTTPVARLSLLSLGDSLVWRIERRGRPGILLDATTGRTITIGEERAVALAQRIHEAPVLRTTLRGHHSGAYPNGALPVHQVDFADGRTAYVNPRDGHVRLRSRGILSATRLGDLHTFDPLHLLPRGRHVRVGSLLATAFVSLILALTGYGLWYLRWRGAERRRSP